MIKYLTTIFLILCFLSCDNLDVQVHKHVLDVRTEGELCKAAIIKNDFYCLFETTKKEPGNRFKKMLSFNNEGEFIEEIFVPKYMQELNSYELFVEKDSLFIKVPRFDNVVFKLNDNLAEIRQTKTRDFTIYQDSSFNVFSSDCGEFGGTIFFQNKQTNEAFEAYNQGFVVNRLNDEYYVTYSNDDFRGVFKPVSMLTRISNPALLAKSNLNLHRDQGSKRGKGVEVLLDTSGIFISTSYIVDNRLLHLYSDKKASHIGEVQRGKMNSLYTFDIRFNAHFSQRIEDGRQLLICEFNNGRKALLTINQNDYDFYYLKKYLPLTSAKRQ